VSVHPHHGFFLFFLFHNFLSNYWKSAFTFEGVKRKLPAKNWHFCKFKELSKTKPGRGHAFFEFVISQQIFVVQCSGFTKSGNFSVLKRNTLIETCAVIKLFSVNFIFSQHK
jgi:hypothetical protein